MRSKKEIMEEFRNGRSRSLGSETLSFLEVLLDIRDLLHNELTLQDVKNVLQEGKITIPLKSRLEND